MRDGSDGIAVLDKTVDGLGGVRGGVDSIPGPETCWTEDGSCSAGSIRDGTGSAFLRATPTGLSCLNAGCEPVGSDRGRCDESSCLSGPAACAGLIFRGMAARAGVLTSCRLAGN